MSYGVSLNYEGTSLCGEGLSLAERFCSFLVPATHGHSALGRAMYQSLKSARVNDKFQEPLYLFLELVRAGVMHGNLWSGRAYSGGPSFGTGEPTSLVLFLRRSCNVR